MRCVSCDDVLTDFEATRKDEVSGAYLDLCNKCFNPIASNFPHLHERYDLYDGDEVESEDPLQTV